MKNQKLKRRPRNTGGSSSASKNYGSKKRYGSGGRGGYRGSRRRSRRSSQSSFDVQQFIRESQIKAAKLAKQTSQQVLDPPPYCVLTPIWVSR